MVNVLGFDIGGANTKAAFAQTVEGRVEDLKTISQYFPVWREPKKLAAVLLKLRQEIAEHPDIDCVGVTMTAELADSYRTKRDGVEDVLTSVQRAFPSTRILVLNVKGHMIPLSQAKMNPIEVAAANWAGTGWMVSKMIENCIVVDVGSTTTSIIPIHGGKVSAEGNTDLEKLVNGELVYTGSLRTNIAAIVSQVPVRGKMARVSSEFFAQSADVHLVLGNIKEEDYTVETSDGKGKTRLDALVRLARVVCADTEMLSEEEIVQIAQHVWNEQVEQVEMALVQVINRFEELKRSSIALVITGVGRSFIARKAAMNQDFGNIIDLEELMRAGIAKVSTAVGVALMTASTIEEKVVQWMR